MAEKPIVPVFFSTDDGYAPFLSVALTSMKANASPTCRYHILILIETLSEENRRRLGSLAGPDFRIEFVSIQEKMEQVKARIPSRKVKTFSSLTIYYRIFIPMLFPQYDKGIYLDADIVVPGDISRLFRVDLGDALIGACADYSIQKIAPFMEYIDKAIGVDHTRYVNSGVLLMDMKGLREVDFAGRFLHLLTRYHFDCVAPDQDYINALCINRFHYLDPTWDVMPTDAVPPFDHPQLIHYNLASKPWANETVQYGDVFWKYAAASDYHQDILDIRSAILANPDTRRETEEAVAQLIQFGIEITAQPESFRTVFESGRETRL